MFRHLILIVIITGIISNFWNLTASTAFAQHDI